MNNKGEELISEKFGEWKGALKEDEYGDTNEKNPRNVPRNTNWAQNVTAPKKEKLTEILSRNLLPTLGVHTLAAACEVVASEQ